MNSPRFTHGSVLLAGLLAFAAFPALASPAKSSPPDCRTNANTFQEKLEPVIESLIDNVPAKQPAAATEAAHWWAAHASLLPASPRVDSSMTAMTRAVRVHRPLAAARYAYEALLGSWRACPGRPTMTDHLMMVDMTGMALYLKARGEPAAPPREAQASIDLVRKRLGASNHAALARSFEQIARAALGAHRTQAAARRDALALLDVVDKAEVALTPVVHHGTGH